MLNSQITHEIARERQLELSRIRTAAPHGREPRSAAPGRRGIRRVLSRSR